MPTTELLDIWRDSVLPLMIAGTITFGTMLVLASMLVSYVRRAIEAT